MSDKEKLALKLVADGQPISMRAVGALKALGLIATNGRASPGYIRCVLTDAGRKAVTDL